MKKQVSLAGMLSVLMILLSMVPAGAIGQVTLQAGGGVGMMIPSGDYSGTPAEYFSGTKYGFSTGFNLHGKARVGLFGFIVKGGAGYSRFSNSGDAQGGGTVEVSHSVITLSVGPEYQISIPAVPVTPYVGADVQLNTFGGETTFKGISSVSSGTVSMSSATRLGVAVNGGVILALGGMKLDIGVTYNMLNLVGKAWTDPQPTKDDREDSYGGLNDEKDPLFSTDAAKHIVGNARSISTIGVTATLMFGL